jgi:GTPase SAR1 family protein
VEAFCSTYSIDLFAIVYSVVDRKTFKVAERILLSLKENEMMLTRGAILVANKTDLERQREVTMQGSKCFYSILFNYISLFSSLCSTHAQLVENWPRR